MPLSVAVVGAGPAGFYAADAVLSAFPDSEINIIEPWPAPFGLVRYGVAPDHLSTKHVPQIFEKILAKNGERFFCNVYVKNRSIAEGSGKSMKQAEKNAASKALKYFENNLIDQ